MEKVLLIQTWGLGDMILTTPLLKVLRAKLPGSHVTVVVGSSASAEVIRGASLCDDVRIMSFRHSSAIAILRFFLQLREDRFDAAVVASRLSPRIAFLLRFLSGVKIVMGDGVGARGWGYTHWRPVDVSRHKVTENLSIIEQLVPAESVGGVYFHLDEIARTEAAYIWANARLEGYDVLGIHPGGGTSECPDKALPVELCQKVVEQFLTGASHRKVVIYFGPDEGGLLRDYEKWGLKRVVLLSGLSLRVVGATIARTRVFLAGDTGIGHIAAAVGTPVVTIAGPTDIVHTRPWGNGHQVVLTERSLDCMPCYETPLYGKCPYGQECMRAISSMRIMQAIFEVLDR